MSISFSIIISIAAVHVHVRRLARVPAFDGPWVRRLAAVRNDRALELGRVALECLRFDDLSA